MAQHVVTAVGPPTAAPPSIGAHYVDSLTGDVYLGGGTASVDDWLLSSGGAANFGNQILRDDNDGVETRVQTSLDGGSSWKETSGSPDDIGATDMAGSGSVMGIGSVLVYAFI